MLTENYELPIILSTMATQVNKIFPASEGKVIHKQINPTTCYEENKTV